MHRFGNSLAPLIYAAMLVALPVIVIPFTGIVPELQKGILVGFVLGGALCVLSLQLLLSRAIEVPRSLFAYLGAPLVLVAGVSAYISGISGTPLWGMGFEWGSFGSLVLFAFSIALGFSVSHHMALLLLRFFTAIVVLTAYASAALLTFAPEVISGSTLAGAWPDLSFLIGAASLVSLALTYYEEGYFLRIAQGALSILALAAFFLFFETVAASVLAGVLIAIAIFLGIRSEGDFAQRIPLLFVASAAFVLALLALGVRGPGLSIQSVGRPSLFVTEIVAVPGVLSTLPHTLLGTGPGTFAATWDRHRPVEFNATPVWNSGVDSAYSGVLTLLTTLGLLGLLSFLLWPFSVVAHLASRFAHGHSVVFLASAACALFSSLSLLFFPGGLPLFLIGALVTGFLFRFGKEDAVFRPSGLFARIMVACVCGILSLLFLWVSTHQFAAALYHARGITELSIDIRKASVSLEKAAGTWSTSTYERDASRALFLDGLAIASKSTEDREAIRTQVDKALRLADKSVKTDPRDVNAWLSRGVLYIQLVPDGPESSAQNAKESLEKAQALGPTRPDVLYIRAALEVRLGDEAKAREYLEQALKLKPDYADALELLQSIKELP